MEVERMEDHRGGGGRRVTGCGRGGRAAGWKKRRNDCGGGEEGGLWRGKERSTMGRKRREDCRMQERREAHGGGEEGGLHGGVSSASTVPD